MLQASCLPICLQTFFVDNDLKESCQLDAVLFMVESTIVNNQVDAHVFIPYCLLDWLPIFLSTFFLLESPRVVPAGCSAVLLQRHKPVYYAVACLPAHAPADLLCG
jgi:G3E family GTPase